MAASLETVVKQLEDSGIVAPGKLENFIPPKANPKTVEELVRELVKQNHLTKFQAQQVALGKAKALILGGYTILDKIGAGGMGQVFKAQHRKMERLVAIKMLPPAMTKDAAALARFQREVVAAAKLRHPNIVAADDADEANGVHFLVMEYVEGTDLSALVKKHGPLEGSRALNYVLQTARGLEFAHSEGVVHRDIKPANLLLDKKGTVKILDMGLARIEAAGDQATQAELTGTGAVMGTVDYMSPEQAFNTKHADARADIYSLGCTLYYLLAGKCTYDGETVIEKILGHREKPIPSLSDVQDGVPDAVQTIFAKMVAKKVEDRYQTMTELIVDLEKAIAGQSSPSNLKPPAETSDTGLTRFFKELPSPTTLKSKPAATKPVAAPVATAPKKANPKLILYGSIAGGVLSLIGIPLVLYLALSSDTAKVKPKTQAAITDTTSSAVPPANYSLQFDGQTSYVEIAPFTFDSQKPLTIEAYATPAKPAQLAAMLRLYGQPGFSLYQNGRASAGLFQATGQSYLTGPPLSSGQRVHLAAIWQKNQVSFYVDGKPHIARSSLAHRPDRSQRLFLGGQLDDPTESKPAYLWTGLLDEIRISQSARYVQGFIPRSRFENDPDTLALYHCDAGSGDVLKDDSGHGHDGKIVGAKWVRADGSPQPAPGDGWITLFDGNSLNGWEVVGEGDWSAADGVLKAAGTGRGWIGSTRTFRDYELELEYRIAAQGNGGVALRAWKEGGISAKPFFEVQILDDKAQATPFPTGSITDHVAARPGLVAPIGQWNKVTVRLDGKRVQVTVNGFTTVDAELPIVRPEGMIGLQVWVQPVEYRNIRIRELNASPTTMSVTPQPTVPAADPGKLFMHDPAFPQWMKSVAAMPAVEQVKVVSQKLVALNAEFDGKLTGYDGSDSPTIENGVVTELGLRTINVTDLSPLRVFTGLRVLNAGGSGGGSSQLVNLSPLQGLKLTTLDITKTKVADLAPLREMPLNKFEANQTPIVDLSPLRGRPLTTIVLMACRTSPDLSPLEDCKSLASLKINGTRVTAAGVAALQKTLPNCKIEWDDPAKSATSGKLFMQDHAFPQWMKDVQAMPVEEQIKEVSKKLVDLNPGFDGKLMDYSAGKSDQPPKIDQGVVTEVGLNCDHVTDLSPVRVLAGLKKLRAVHDLQLPGGLTDLSPLAGLPLTQLILSGSTKLSDLSPLRGIKLTYFYASYTAITDLSPLEGMPLEFVICGSGPLSNISPLKGMQLTQVILNGSQVTDLSPLRGAPLKSFSCTPSKLSDLSPLVDCPNLTTVNITSTKVTADQVAALQKALPNCKIDWDDPAKAPTK